MLKEELARFLGVLGFSGVAFVENFLVLINIKLKSSTFSCCLSSDLF